MPPTASTPTTHSYAQAKPRGRATPSRLRPHSLTHDIATAAGHTPPWPQLVFTDSHTHTHTHTRSRPHTETGDSRGSGPIWKAWPWCEQDRPMRAGFWRFSARNEIRPFRPGPTCSALARCSSWPRRCAAGRRIRPRWVAVRPSPAPPRRPSWPPTARLHRHRCLAASAGDAPRLAAAAA